MTDYKSVNDRMEPEIIFHRLPKDLERHIWVKNMNRTDWVDSANERIRLNYFQENFFYKTERKIRLQYGSTVSTVFEKVQVYLHSIKNALPSDWKYKILSKVVFGSPPKLEVCLKVALFTQEEIQAWMEALEEKVQCSYSILTTRKCTGEKVLFKRRWHCQHKTRDKNSYPNSKTGTRNTRCPSKLTVSLMRIQKKYRGKDPPDPAMPCIIDYVVTHNHPPSLSVRFRRVGRNVQEKLKQLFSVGYNASTAYEYIKVDIQLNNPDNYEELLVNRSICPDRNFCHRWYNLYIKEHGAIDFTDKIFLVKQLEDYNNRMGEECANIEIIDESFVIVLCPPLFKRVHENIKMSSEIVFMAAINPSDNDGSKTFFMLTHSECGALPLGIIITSAESPEFIAKGLEMLRNIVGDVMFYGKKDGPDLFVVDDCEAEQIALNTVWPNSEILFCVFHILHTLWRYLLCTKNGIHRDDGLAFFKQFRQIMVAPTKDECDQMFNDAIMLAAGHDNYLQVLEAYWERRDMWTVSYRNPEIPQKYKEILTLNESETTLCILKGSIFHRMRSFNVIQLADFLLSKFVDYYTERLLDGANGRLIRNMSRNVPVTIDIQRIEQVNKYLYFVPSLKVPNVNYAVNTEILACTCIKNNTGYICFHIGWLLTICITFQEKIEAPEQRELFYKTATGNSFPTVKLEKVNEIDILKTHLTDPQQQQEVERKSDVIEQLIVAGNEIITLQIVKDDKMTDEESDVDEIMKESTEIGTLITDEEQAVAEGQKIINELSTSFNSFLTKSPFKAVPALQKLLIQTNAFSSVEEFIMACETYG